jgi:hypothetical protein
MLDPVLVAVTIAVPECYPALIDQAQQPCVRPLKRGIFEMHPVTKEQYVIAWNSPKIPNTPNTLVHLIVRVQPFS